MLRPTGEQHRLRSPISNPKIRQDQAPPRPRGFQGLPRPCKCARGLRWVSKAYQRLAWASKIFQLSPSTWKALQSLWRPMAFEEFHCPPLLVMTFQGFPSSPKTFQGAAGRAVIGLAQSRLPFSLGLAMLRTRAAALRRPRPLALVADRYEAMRSRPPCRGIEPQRAGGESGLAWPRER